jgi:hypothetical protein
MTEIAAAFLLGIMGLPATDVRTGAPETCGEVAGYVEMRFDGALLIQDIASGINEHVAPGSGNYEFYLSMLGPVAPGERKPYTSFMGYARMDSDGMIHLYHGGARADRGFNVEPFRALVRPQDADYRAVIDHLAGIVPGRVRGIPTRPCPAAPRASDQQHQTQPR